MPVWIQQLLVQLGPHILKGIGKGIKAGTGSMKNKSNNAFDSIHQVVDENDDSEYIRPETSEVIDDARRDLLGTHNVNEQPPSDVRLKTQFGMDDAEIQAFLDWYNSSWYSSFGKVAQPQYSDHGFWYKDDNALETMIKEFKQEVASSQQQQEAIPQQEEVTPMLDNTTREETDAVDAGSKDNEKRDDAYADILKDRVPLDGDKPPLDEDKTPAVVTSNEGNSGKKKDDIPLPLPPKKNDINVNDLLKHALRNRFIGNAIGSFLQLDGGGFGNTQKFGTSIPAQIGKTVSGISNLAYGEKKGEIARRHEQQVIFNLDEQLKEIDVKERAGELTPYQAEYTKNKLREDAHNRIRRMQHTLHGGTAGVSGSTPVEGTVSDVRLKSDATIALRMMRSGMELSDEDYKRFSDIDPQEMFEAINEEGPPYRGHEIEFLHNMVKDREGEDYVKPIQFAGIWSPETLQGYAMWIKNAHYKYKPQAISIDASIDPEQEHIGPMAQEIEKVNPAAVIETPEGVKTVDTGRLALMNAGAIADLARQMIKMEQKLEGAA